MSDYTPTTGEMRDAWIEYKCMSECEECPAEFYRWLAEVKAQAWQECSEAYIQTITSGSANRGFWRIENPYRQGEEQ